MGDEPSEIEVARSAGLSDHIFPGGHLRDFILPLLANG